MRLDNVRPSVSPWSWVPSLYFAEAIPYFIVNVISVTMFKRLGMSNVDIALYTGWLYLPWVIKPFWSPFVDIISTKRWWVVLMEIVISVTLAAVSFTIDTPAGPLFSYTLAGFWVIAFASATHDIAADGYYMLALDSNRQSLFVGIRSTFYKLASIIGQGVLVVLAGVLETKGGDIPKAWLFTMLLLSVVFVMLTLYHALVLPKCEPSRKDSLRHGAAKNIFLEFGNTFVTFFSKKGVWIAICFMLLYRLPEALLIKMLSPFLLDPLSNGGLGLSTQEVGAVYGTVGTVGLIIGGIAGGVYAASRGLKKSLMPMALALALPCAVFVVMSIFQMQNLFLINLFVFVEQFGYGFGFTAYMLYLIYFSEGPYKTAHYSLCTAFMALGMMLPGMVAGWIQEKIGYTNFFWFVMVCCIATIVVTKLVSVDDEFGKKPGVRRFNRARR